MRTSTDTSTSSRAGAALRDGRALEGGAVGGADAPPDGAPLTEGEARDIARRAGLVAGNIARVIVGKEEGIEACVVALLAGGHVLMEDVPGVGKTLLAKPCALGATGRFTRMQFTPDLLPTDVTGVTIFDQQGRRFEFQPGPGLRQHRPGRRDQPHLAQDAVGLLECMEERQVDDRRRQPTRCARPFMVIATQNPIEYEGTYPLPEAQLDRFYDAPEPWLPLGGARGGDPSGADLWRPVRRAHAGSGHGEVLRCRRR